MRITDLKASVVKTTIAWEPTNPAKGNMDAIVVQIFTDTGITGKALDVPLYQLMGAYRDKIPAYASTKILAKPGDYGEYASQLRKQGYKAIKLHVKGEPEWDVEACQATRAGAPDPDLMLDSSCHYTRLFVCRSNLRTADIPLRNGRASPKISQTHQG